MSAPRFKPTIPEVAPHIRAYYAMEGNSVGGSLHVLLDDANIGDSTVEFCKRFAVERGDVEGAILAALLQRMSLRQRRALSGTTFYSWASGVADCTPSQDGGAGSTPSLVQLFDRYIGTDPELSPLVGSSSGEGE